MAKVSAQQEAQYAYNAGFRGKALSDVVGIAWAESRFYTIGDNTIGNYPAGSRDRGILQINNYWHPDVSDACANDPQCANNAAYRISKGGTDFSSWVTYKNGAYQGEQERYIVPDSSTGTSPIEAFGNTQLPNGQTLATTLGIRQTANAVTGVNSAIGTTVSGVIGKAAKYLNPQYWIEVAALGILALVFIAIGAVMLTSGAVNDTDVGKIARDTFLT